MKPNIVIVMTDQQRASLRKGRGFALDTMPFLDSWAQEGTDFHCAYTSNPTCMPARVSMFSGRYPSATHVRSNANVEDAFYTEDLLDVVRKNGYLTALCGKNHSHRKPEDFDFHETNFHLGANDLPCTRQEEKDFDAFLKTLKFRCSDAPSPFGLEAQLPYRNVSSAIRFLDQAAGQDKPFFLWLSFAEPHNPYQVPEPYFDMFPPESLPRPAAGRQDAAKKGERYLWLHKQWDSVYGDRAEEIIGRSRSNYCGMLRLIDDQFKRFIQALRQRDLEKDTVVVYLSDHGDYAGEYGLMRKGVDLPECLVNIPMIWKIPGGKSNGACQAAVSIVDLLPTLCDLLQTPVPAGVQGKSLLPLLTGRDVEPEAYSTAYAEVGYGGDYWEEGDMSPQDQGCLPGDGSFNCLNPWTQSGQCRMVRRGRYKLQMDMRGSNYLYDLAADPQEVNNLWEDENFRAVRDEMMQLLIGEMLRKTDVLPMPRGKLFVKI